MNMDARNNKPVKKDKRRYKYGSISVVFTLVFIALVLVINLVFSSLSLSGELTVDLTKEDYTAISDETVQMLSALGKDLDITIYFMSARDTYELEENNYKGINLTGIVRDMAENLQKIFDGSGDKGTVRVEYKEINHDPEFEKKYYEESTTKLSSTSIIVQGKYHFRVLDLKAFFVKGEDNTYTAFNGEYRFAAAMLQSSMSQPQVVSFTYGHGEPLNAEGPVQVDGSYPAAGLVDLLSGAGFEVQYVNFPQDQLDDRTKILITYDPQEDFSWAEIEKLNTYISARNSYMCFVDAATPVLGNLQSCLNDNYGMNYKPNYRITDSTHSLDSKVENLNVTYPALDSEAASGSAAYQIRKTISDMGGTVNVAMPESVELMIKEANTQDSFTIETVLNTFDTAVSAKLNGEEGTSGKEMPLALLSTKRGYGENNVSEYSYVMLVGSTEFADTEHLSGATGNRRVMLSAARVFSSESVAPDIDSKSFGDTALAIETGTATNLTWVICTVLPGIVLIMGMVVFYKRRHL